jgi:LPPG:FO 2-phospho-L-lactate transferase
MLDVVGADLAVIANTGDDIELYGAHVSPDPDLVTYWLADRIDERGWGLRDDSFAVMDGLRELGADVWFSLGDRDLAVGLERRRRLQAGGRLTEALAELARALHVPARVLPMSDDPVRTRVLAHGGWRGLQEFLIRDRATGPVEGVDFAGVEAAMPTGEVLQAIAAARAIVIGPSNPVVSIGPILALRGVADALRAAPAPVVAVSPIVGGEVVKGPTAAFMAWAGHELSATGVVEAYDAVIDGLVADERTDRVPVLQTDVLMAGPAGRRRVAAEALNFAEALSGGR